MMKSLAEPLYMTQQGAAYVGDACELLLGLPDESLDLVFTSPPFALQRQKEYGNVAQDRYVDWLLSFAREVKRVLRSTGSFVLDPEALAVRTARFGHSTIITLSSEYVMNWVETWPRSFSGSTLPACFTDRVGKQGQRFAPKIPSMPSGGFPGPTFQKRILRRCWWLIRRA
jgi:hypothetical protein